MGACAILSRKRTQVDGWRRSFALHLPVPTFWRLTRVNFQQFNSEVCFKTGTAELGFQRAAKKEPR